MLLDVPKELRLAALHWLAETDHVLKSAGVIALAQAWKKGEIDLEARRFPDNAATHPRSPVCFLSWFHICQCHAGPCALKKAVLR